MINYNLVRIAKIIALSFVIIPCSSCFSIQPTVEKLMKAPKLTGDFYEISRALESSAGKNIRLKYPKYGDYKSAFILKDIDGDGIDEAIVFYSDLSEKTDAKVRMSIFDKSDKSWNNIYSTYGLGSDIGKVVFANLTSDPNPQILINWIVYGGAYETLGIYKYDNNTLSLVFEESYLTDIQIADIDGDSKNELIIIDKTSEQSPNIKLIKEININEEGVLSKKIQEISKTFLKRGSSKYENIAIGNIDIGKPAIFVDALKEDSLGQTFFTEIISFQLNSNHNISLSNILYSSDAELDPKIKKTARKKPILCRDIDKNGIVEIPKELEIKSTLFRSIPSDQKAVSSILWQRYINGSLEPTLISFENIEGEFSFIFPKHWYEKKSVNSDYPDGILPFVYVCKNAKYENEWIFRTIPDNNDEESDGNVTENTTTHNPLTTSTELFRLKVVTKSENPDILSGYVKISDTNTHNYYVKISDTYSPFSLSISQIKKYFHRL